jgi:hypothetical protein
MAELFQTRPAGLWHRRGGATRLTTMSDQHRKFAQGDLCDAWNRQFTSDFGEPRFKKRGEAETLRLPQDRTYDAEREGVRLPKLGEVRLRRSRTAVGQLKHVLLRLEGKRSSATPVPMALATVMLPCR